MYWNVLEFQCLKLVATLELNNSNSTRIYLLHKATGFTVFKEDGLIKKVEKTLGKVKNRF